MLASEAFLKKRVLGSPRIDFSFADMVDSMVSSETIDEAIDNEDEDFSSSLFSSSFFLTT